MEFNEQQDREEIYSKPVRAGKRTYFFDVKSTKGEDLYLTITESKKRFRDDGTFFYEKHKIFLYKEDFDKFSEGLNDAVGFIQTHNRANGATNHSDINSNSTASSGDNPTDNSSTHINHSPSQNGEASGEAQGGSSTWSNVEFDDLGGPANPA